MESMGLGLKKLALRAVRNSRLQGVGKRCAVGNLASRPESTLPQTNMETHIAPL